MAAFVEADVAGGRADDAKGRTVDFKNTVLIMTSNLGAHLLSGEALENENSWELAREEVTDVLKQHFRPEFLNRVDDIVLFRPLGEAQLAHIVGLRLEDMKHLLADRRITLEMTEGAKHQLLLTGYDRAYGARPLKRALQKLVQDPLAIKILDGEVLHGDHILVDADPLHNRLQFTVEDRKTVPA
jgi:ATP-dependent Clp protease ATP-binding subunit ClpB